MFMGVNMWKRTHTRKLHENWKIADKIEMSYTQLLVNVYSNMIDSCYYVMPIKTENCLNIPNGVSYSPSNALYYNYTCLKLNSFKWN